MHIAKTTAFVLLLTVSCMLAANQPAPPAPDYQKTVAGYQVHFNAMVTADLQADIARRYDIQRSQDVVLINLHVRKDDGALGEARKSEVTVQVRTLIGQQRDIQLREIDEGDTVYYIGTLRKPDGDRLIFDFTIKPEDARRAFEVRFERNY